MAAGLPEMAMSVAVGILFLGLCWTCEARGPGGTCPADTLLIDPDTLTPEQAREILMSDDPRYEGFHPSGRSPAPTFLELALGFRADVQPHPQTAYYHHGPDALNLTDFNARRVTCRRRNLTGIEEYTVQMVNSSSLLSWLGDKNDTTGRCVVVLFYAPWCPFCAQVAPHYNALARAFYHLDVLAIDAVHFSNLNSRFGTIAVPNIIVFHNAKAVARFNGTERSFPVIRDFIGNVTGLRPNRSVALWEGDAAGPVPSVPERGVDVYLVLAWLVICTFSGVQFSKSGVGRRLLAAAQAFGAHEQAAPNL